MLAAAASGLGKVAKKRDQLRVSERLNKLIFDLDTERDSLEAKLLDLEYKIEEIKKDPSYLHPSKHKKLEKEIAELVSH